MSPICNPKPSALLLRLEQLLGREELNAFIKKVGIENLHAWACFNPNALNTLEKKVKLYERSKLLFSTHRSRTSFLGRLIKAVGSKKASALNEYLLKRFEDGIENEILRSSTPNSRTSSSPL